MTKEEFDKLEVGNRIKFGSTEYEIIEVERYKKTPTEYDVHSITVDGNLRVKKDDFVVSRIILL